MADVVEKRLAFVISAENETSPALTAVEASLGNLSKLAESLTAAFRGIVPAVEAAQTAIRGVGESGAKSMSELSESVARVNNTTWENLARGASAVANEIKTEFEQVGRSIEESLAVTMPTPKGGATRGGAATPKGGGGIFSNEGSMNLLYGGMSVGAMVAPVAAGLSKSFEDFKNFEKQMSAVNTMLGLSQEQFRGLEQQVISLSGVLPSTSEELASGLYNAVGAGYSLADSLSIVKTASEAAAAGQTDMDTATGLLTSVLRAYGMQASEVTKVADQLFGANSAAKASFDDFARSLGTVIGPAANAGVSFGEAAAALGALTNTGLSAQQSAEDLRALLMSIISPSEGAKKAAAALGIEWDQAALKSKGLAGMLADLMKAAGGNNDAISKVVGTEAAFTAATNLAGKGAESFKQALQAVADSAGKTHEAMQAIEQTPTYKLEEFAKSAQNLGLQIWQNAAPALASLADIGQRVIQWFDNLSPQTKKIVSDIVVFGTAFVVVSAGAMMFLSAIGQAKLGLEVLKGAFDVFKVGAIGAIRSVTVELMANPMLAGVLLAVTAIALLTYAVVTHWSQIRDWTVRTFSAIGNWITTKWNEIITFFSELPGRIWSFLSKLPEDAASALGGMLAAVIYGVPKLVSELANGAANMLHAFGVWISQLPGNLWNWLVQAINHAANFASELWNRAGTAGSNFIHGLGDWLAQLPGNFSRWLQEVINTIAGFPGRLWQWGANLADAFVGGIRSKAASIRDAFVQGFNNARAAIEGHSPPVEGPFRDIDKWGANVARAYIDGILSQRDAMRQAMLAFVHAGAVPAMNGPSPALAGAGAGGGASQVPSHVQNIGELHVHVPIVPSPEDPKAFSQRIAWSLKTMGR